MNHTHAISWIRVEMSSLASYSLGTSLTSLFQPQKINNNSQPLPYHIHVKSCSQIQPLEEVVQNQNERRQFKRREAIGLAALNLGLLQSFLQEPQPSSAVEAVAPPCEFKVAPSGLAFCDKLVGTGPQALEGQLIKAHYVGRLENGKIFDSSYNRGKPLTFRVGVGEVIKGWDEGILGGDGIPPMLPGGKRVLKLPPELGYGSRGAGCKGGSCVIPPDSVLLFDVEFVGKV